MDLSDQRTQIMLVIALAVLGGLYAWFTYLYSPKKEEIGTLQTDIETLQTEIANLQRQADRAPAVAESLRAAQNRWALILLQFPAEAKEEEVLGNLNLSETTTGVYISNFTRGARRTRELYIEQDYTIRLLGRYHQLGMFIANLASMPRRMSVARMQLTHPTALESGTGAGAGPIPTEEEIIITLTVTAYVVRER